MTDSVNESVTLMVGGIVLYPSLRPRVERVIEIC